MFLHKILNWFNYLNTNILISLNIKRDNIHVWNFLVWWRLLVVYFNRFNSVISTHVEFFVTKMHVKLLTLTLIEFRLIKRHRTVIYKTQNRKLKTEYHVHESHKKIVVILGAAFSYHFSWKKKRLDGKMYELRL